jgi:KaiC/GvpD/RAD55 family RecA-like ATPase
MTEKISTGLKTIDRQLSGGLEPGSLLSLVAKPTRQSEGLLRKIAETRPTLYLTTLRKEEAVEAELPESLTDSVFVKSTSRQHSRDDEFSGERPGNGSDTPTASAPDTMVDSVSDIISDVDRDINVIVDPTNPLEETGDKDAYRQVLNELKSTMLDTGGLGILHCIGRRGPPAFRDITLTISDVVCELNLESNMDKLEYQLTIPKNRGGYPILEKTTLKMDSDIWVDGSRRI